MKIRIPTLIQKLAPLWTKKLRLRKNFDAVSTTCVIKGVTLNLLNYGCCIVGETLNLINKKETYSSFEDRKKKLGWDNDDNKIELAYHKGCQDCLDFSGEFHSIIEWRQDMEELESELRRFAKHLKEKHKRLVNKVMENDKSN